MITDHQDDLGTFLRQTHPTLAESSFVKEASWKEKPNMLDREFALILVEPNGTEHKKLAMHDGGNTLASVAYLLTGDHSLPEPAIKLASYNLLNAAMHYGLYDAFGDTLLYTEKIGSAFDLLAALADALPNDGILDERRVSVKEAMGGGMGYSSPTVATTSKNTAAPVNTIKTFGKQQPMLKKASYDLIKEAEYMWPDLDPVDKRAFALIIKEAAREEAAAVPAKIAQYAGNELNPQFESIIHRRLDYVSNDSLRDDYERFSKVAFVMDLADATETLYLLDEQAGLLERYSSNLPDPVLSVYGCSTKQASWSWSHGGVYCTENDIMLLCKDPVKRAQFESVFNQNTCESFMKDPIKQFESKPIEQQIIIARMANTTAM